MAYGPFGKIRDSMVLEMSNIGPVCLSKWYFDIFRDVVCQK